MSRPDRLARRDLAEVMDVLGGTSEDEILRDTIGPAVYRLHPQPSTAAACLVCRHISLIPSIPKVPALVWECPGCGHKWALEPPAGVWLEGSRPELVRPW